MSEAQQVEVAFSRLYFFPQISSIPSVILTLGKFFFSSCRIQLRSLITSWMKPGSPKLVMCPAEQQQGPYTNLKCGEIMNTGCSPQASTTRLR